MLRRGEIVVIVKGRNIGRRGIFIKNVAFKNCMVQLENSTIPQRFLRTSIAKVATPRTPAAAAAPPPTPVATAVLLGGVSPGEIQAQRTQQLFCRQRAQEIDTLFRNLSDIMNSIDELEQKLKDLLLADT
jgi:hypothetical protein